MKAQQFFSELDARTEATAWEDRLLNANALTVKNTPCLPIRGASSIAECIDVEFREYPEEDLEDLDFIYFAGKVGQCLESRGICLDIIVRDLCAKASRSGINDDGFHRRVEEAFLNGVETPVE